MPVHGSGIQSLHVVKGDWWIDKKTEQSRANKVPKGHSDEEVDRPFIRSNPDLLLSRAGESNVFPGLKPDENQRHDFQRAENRSQAKDNIRRSGEIEMMKGPDDSAGKENDCRKQNSA